MMKYCSLFFLAIFVMGAPSVPGQVDPKAISTTKFQTKLGIIYAQGISGPLKADVYIPSGIGPFPGILFIHGGGWVDGNRNQMVKLIKALAGQGFVGFTIEYDVNPVHFPVSSQESFSALKYLREHATAFNLDASRIAVAGSSAGGELAALLALNPAAKLQAAVILNGVLDLTALGDKSAMVTNYLGGACTAMLEACKDASPITHVHVGAPPFFVGHGTADETVPYSQAESFIAALRADKVLVRVFAANGAGHTYWKSDQFYESNREAVEQFLSDTLSRQKRQTNQTRP